MTNPPVIPVVVQRRVANKRPPHGGFWWIFVGWWWWMLIGWWWKPLKGMFWSGPAAAGRAALNHHDQSKATRNIANAVQAQGSPVVSVPSPGDPPAAAGELERLSTLHAQGALTDTEFAAAKARLLGI